MRTVQKQCQADMTFLTVGNGLAQVESEAWGLLPSAEGALEVRDQRNGIGRGTL